MLKIYEHPLSPYAQKVKIALYEKGIEFEAVVPDIFGNTNEEFMASSPRREVPSLIDGETTVFDSTIILEYIEDKWPHPPMLPAMAAERARVRMLEEMCDTYVEAINWGVAEIRVFGRAKDALADAMMARAQEQITGVHSWLERQLGAQEFFNGVSFGWGDFCVYPYVAASFGYGMQPPPKSRLLQWFDRVSTRDSIAKVAAAALEALQGFQNLGPIIEQGLFVREYRDHRLEWMLRSGGRQVVLDGMDKHNIRFAIELS